MPTPQIVTVKEKLFWSYANLAMAHSAITPGKQVEKYKPLNYMIRAKLFKGLMSGTMNIRSLFDDEKEKMRLPQMCAFCGSTENFSIDHLIPRFKGGDDSGDNLVLACRSCNSSKGKGDLMEWYHRKGGFPPLLILRRYLKLVHQRCLDLGVMDLELSGTDGLDLPFNLSLIPSKYPPPPQLVFHSGNAEP